MHREWIAHSLTKKMLVAVLCFMVLLLGHAFVAGAQEEGQEERSGVTGAIGGALGGPVEREEGGQVTAPGKLGKLERKVEAIEARSLSETIDLHLYGYVDVSYTGNLNNPSSGTSSLRVFDVDSDAFRVHMAQIVLEKVGKFGENLADNFGFRVKLNFGEDSQFTGGSDFEDEVDFQEVYAQYLAPVGNGIDLRGGRQNTLIGYEVIESPYNDNFSRSWLFGFGQPFTTTGVRAAYDITDKISFAFGAISGFTQQRGDTNSALSFETALSYQPIDRLGLTGYLFWGDEKGRKAPGSGDVILGGGILSFQATEQTSFVLEGYYANAANASAVNPATGLPVNPSNNARWGGFAAYLIHDFTDQWGFRVRGELFEDASGARTCQGSIGTPTDPNSPPPPSANVCPTVPDSTNQFGARNAGTGGGSPGPVFAPTAQTMWETTFTLQFRPIPSFISRVEFRYDKSNKNAFQFGTRATNNQKTLAAEVIYLF